MSGGLGVLLAATAAFVGGHILLSSTRARPAIVARLGERGFLGAYSALMIALFAAMLVAYGRAPRDLVLWSEVPGLRWVTLVLMLPAAVLLVLGVTARNPAAMMQGRLVGDPVVATGALAVTRHPMMWGIGLWAVAHLLVNGDAASVVLMGGLGFLALSGTVLIDRKRRAALGADWDAFAARTSNVPFAAILSGRARFDAAAIGRGRLLAGGLLFVLLLALHPWAFGVSPLPVGLR